MRTSAWIFMLTAWTIIIALTVACFARLLTSKNVLQADSEPPSDDRPEPWGAPPT